MKPASIQEARFYNTNECCSINLQYYNNLDLISLHYIIQTSLYYSITLAVDNACLLSQSLYLHHETSILNYSCDSTLDIILIRLIKNVRKHPDEVLVSYQEAGRTQILDAHDLFIAIFFLINQFCSGLFFNSHVPIVLMLTNVRMTYRRTSTNNPDVHLDSIHVYFLHHPSGLNQSAVATKGDLIDSVPQIMHMIDVRRV